MQKQLFANLVFKQARSLNKRLALLFLHFKEGALKNYNIKFIVNNFLSKMQAKGKQAYQHKGESSLIKAYNNFSSFPLKNISYKNRGQRKNAQSINENYKVKHRGGSSMLSKTIETYQQYRHKREKYATISVSHSSEREMDNSLSLPKWKNCNISQTLYTKTSSITLNHETPLRYSSQIQPGLLEAIENENLNKSVQDSYWRTTKVGSSLDRPSPKLVENVNEMNSTKSIRNENEEMPRKRINEIRSNIESRKNKRVQKNTNKIIQSRGKSQIEVKNSELANKMKKFVDIFKKFQKKQMEMQKKRAKNKQQDLTFTITLQFSHTMR